MINKNGHNVPENKISIFGHGEDKTFPSIESLKNNFRRDWFLEPYYFCLPIKMANQYGFVIKSLYDFTVRWDGGEGNDSVTITCDDVVEPGVYGSRKQKIYAFFKNGTFTVCHDWMLHTPKGVNIYITQPPNFFIPGLHTMSALVETDNLHRDFTFTFKITIPNMDIKIKRGDMLALILPIERYTVDSYEVVDAMQTFDKEVLQGEIKALLKYTEIDRTLQQERGRWGTRTEEEYRQLGSYHKGVDPYGDPFEEHQRKPL